MTSTSRELSEEKSGWIRTQLADGETVAWSGQPVPRYFTPGMPRTFVLALVWTILCIASWIAWTAWRWDYVDEWSFLGDVPLAAFCIVAGLVVMSLPSWERRRLERTAYAITDRRAIVVTQEVDKTFQVASYAASAILVAERTVHADGTANLLFAEKAQAIEKGRSFTKRVGFEHVQDVAGVEQALDALRALRP